MKKTKNITRRRFMQTSLLLGARSLAHAAVAKFTDKPQAIVLDGRAAGKRFDGIGTVNGGGSTSVLLKDYPEPQRSQVLDLIFKPKFGASLSTFYVEIPGDGNSTQGSMPSHMHSRDDLNYSRGYIWWTLAEAKRRNPNLTLDAAVWSAPGWIGNRNFWSQDAADYDVKWLEGLRNVYDLELDAIGCRNEHGVSYQFAEMLRASLDADGFNKVKVHGFDNWPSNKLDFVKDMVKDEKLRNAIDVISAHTFSRYPASAEVQAMADQMRKPIWNTEEHVYKEGFDCAISIVKTFNENFIVSGATKIVNWYDVAALYPMQPYSHDPAMLLAHWPWSGHYEVREALWGYAHYGQFTEVGWQYLDGGSGNLDGGGSFVSLKSPGPDYSIIMETQDAKSPQRIRVQLSGLSVSELCLWHSNSREQFVKRSAIKPRNGEFEITLEPGSIYSLSTTRGQQKGSFNNIPVVEPFPFPYRATFNEYSPAEHWGHLPRYTADINGVFEVADRPGGHGKCLQQAAPVRPLSWAPDWLPYTILGSDEWQDYEVSADIYLNPGDSAGVMGRVTSVGTGYGCIPQGYYLQLADDGQCRLVVVRGNKPKKNAGDAEHQALMNKQKEEDQSGEKELSAVQLAGHGPGEWHQLKIRFSGGKITGLVNGKPVVEVADALYSRGMAGLMAGGDKVKFSMPYFDNILINHVGGAVPGPSLARPNQIPIYRKILKQ